MGAPRDILQGLLMHGPQDSAPGIVAATGLSAPSIRRWIKREDSLMRRARLIDFDDAGLRLGPGLGLVLAFSAGAEHLSAGLVDASGHVHCPVRAHPEPRQFESPPAALLERVRGLAVSVLEQAMTGDLLLTPAGNGGRALRLIGATMSWPLAMDRDTTPMQTTVDPLWRGNTLRHHLSKALDLPVRRCHSINDANAGALAIAFDHGADTGPGSVMCVHLAAGVGLGTVHQSINEPHRLPFIDAHLVSGRNGLAGEIGHCIVDASIIEELNTLYVPPILKRQESLLALDGERLCDCAPNAKGHLDVVIGAETVLTRLGRFHEGDSLVAKLEEIHRDADQHDQAVVTCLDHVGQVLARVLNGPVAALDPTCIVLSGALSSSHVLKGLKKRRELGELNQSVDLELYAPGSPDRDLIGLRGSALAVLRGALYRGFFERLEHHARQPSDHAWDQWSGWNADRTGSQTGALDQDRSSEWEYRPLAVDHGFIEHLQHYRHPDGPHSRPRPASQAERLLIRAPRSNRRRGR